MHTKARKILTAAAVAILTTTGVVAVTDSAAHASLACSGTSIRINGGSGAEAPSYATGHSHSTGNHYVRAIIGNNWEWWADNNGGSDGDTKDTYYGTISC
ncbi:hypothetical protein ACGFI4_14315 [Micromonospora carbonacea]|uniref:hypothetical protein n=1 Tax=Micromonospora carbonacea TaxID=47853 RepID=UPI003712014A